MQYYNFYEGEGVTPWQRPTERLGTSPLPPSVTALHNQATQQMVVTATSINQRFYASTYPLVIAAMPR